MINTFLIHGSYGHPTENWFPWLKVELEKSGYNIIAPAFPTPDNQSLDSWIKVFEPYHAQLNSNTIMIGHSLGPAFILNLLEKSTTPINACYLVSGFLGLLDNPDFDQINKTFTDRDFNWNSIKQNCKQFYIYHSDNDPYVPLNKSIKLAEKLGVEVKIVKGAGHFNLDSGYDKFELLLDDIKDPSKLENKDI